MAIELETITHGDKHRVYGEFKDAEGDPAEISEVSGDGVDGLWLRIDGQNSIAPYLNRENAADLWPLLKRFADTGTIAEPSA